MTAYARDFQKQMRTFAPLVFGFVLLFGFEFTAGIDPLLPILLFVILFGLSIFFFQAEDGIRRRTVTGVQTCALPISLAPFSNSGPSVFIAAPATDIQTTTT